MTQKERHIDIQNLKRHQEFHAFKLEMEAFCDEMNSLDDIKTTGESRITLSQEIAGRIWARDKVRNLLSTLGLVDKTKPTIIDKTGE